MKSNGFSFSPFAKFSPMATTAIRLLAARPLLSYLSFPISLNFPASLPKPEIRLNIGSSASKLNWGGERKHDALTGGPEEETAPRGQLRHRHSAGSTRLIAATRGFRTSHRPDARCSATSGFRIRPEQDASGGGVLGRSPRLIRELSPNVPAEAEHSGDVCACVCACAHQ